MPISEIRILPPLAFARLGSGSQPVANYILKDSPERPLDFRTITPAKTLFVDEVTGEIHKVEIPETVQFTEGEKIRPVAPFLEVFAVTGPDTLEPLTAELLAANGFAPDDVHWSVEVANRKVVRRTGNEDDAVTARTGWFSDHTSHPLQGFCNNFLPDLFITFGSVRYIKPSDSFPEIRFRFTPAQGLIYGPEPGVSPEADAANEFLGDRRIYRHDGGWVNYEVPDGGNDTLPPALYAIQPPAPPWLHDNVAVSRGYFDDACDGIVSVRLHGTTLTASARVSAGPPAAVPDSYFIRTLADDLDQALLGPKVAADEPLVETRARAQDILRRAYETVRFMNLIIMNGNSFKGRPALLLDSMPEEEAADTERALRPVMPPASVDTKAILNLHEQVYAALSGGSAPWFIKLLRQPEDVTDFTDFGRRKMPALMCGADNGYLALTHRQIDTIRRVAENALYLPELPPAGKEERNRPALTPRNLTAQLHHKAAGNPASSRLEAAVANCCPGLEVDFRAVWRRLFTGVVLREYDNLVVDIDPDVTDPQILALKGRRLLRVGDKNMMATLKGPATSDTEAAIVLTTDENPNGLGPLEWSNALAKVLAESQGQIVDCYFSKQPCPDAHVPYVPDQAEHIPMLVRHFFEENTAVISPVLAQPGELTQGLCSPWQNDYRECSCYYWASARPDFVNVDHSSSGLAKGDNWFQKKRTGSYVADDYTDTRLVLYDDLFLAWEKWVRIQIGGRDIPARGPE